MNGGGDVFSFLWRGMNHPPGASRAPEPPTNAREGERLAGNRRPMILLVEDDFDLREVIADRLDEDGCDVRSAADGQQALAAIATRRPDVIVTDLMMPNMSGWDLIGELKRRRDLKNIPVIVITAAQNAPAIPLGYPVFVKPIRTDALVRAIDALMTASSR